MPSPMPTLRVGGGEAVDRDLARVRPATRDEAQARQSRRRHGEAELGRSRRRPSALPLRSISVAVPSTSPPTDGDAGDRPDRADEARRHGGRGRVAVGRAHRELAAHDHVGAAIGLGEPALEAARAPSRSARASRRPWRCRTRSRERSERCGACATRCRAARRRFMSAPSSGRGSRPREVRLVVDDRAVGEEDHAVGSGGRRGVVGDHHDRLPALVDGAAEEREDVGGGVRVEVAGRLVGEHDRRAGRQGAGDRDALLLAAGQLGRAVRQARSREADRVEQVRDPVARRRRARRVEAAARRSRRPTASAGGCRPGRRSRRGRGAAS